MLSLLEKQQFTTGTLGRLFGNWRRKWCGGIFVNIVTIKAFYNIHSKTANKTPLECYIELKLRWVV